MDIIPAIDLLDGNCVRLIQGDYSKVTKFSSNPVDQAITWQELGAKRLHLVDLDGAKIGDSQNNQTIRSIAENIDIPIQVGGGVRSRDRVSELISYGIDKVILGTVAIENPEEVEKLANDYPGKIIVGIDARDGRVATRGWIEESQVKAIDLAARFSNSKVSAIIYTDISTDGTLNGPNLRSLREITSSTKIPIIASGGIGSLSDIISLFPFKKLGVDGVIVGRALYDKKVDLSEAIKVLSNIDLEDTQANSSLNT
ncbi:MULTISPECIES: 1-(5-phosphoribosyl)-5-[(5-phosphoribosylamino)methylideneamino]imidazole-4-carboxamide isomerase [Prochlorococcus]|uniref:1-(5-phosphoribosyl)-5-[(5- phosphoribosylamino)methylideneamino]imidazole-4- carboxamide isomerase n=1 Tax=Prochlorococcus TaxID=1218 RepID=UPI0005337939|nr:MULTISPECIES: 1-(5-phosphoribosyl)-5-[(5-phosphoribosylamino)methylideneamino]imidazole-4-carboxamide isomerase [Prochlorococcus]KGG12381.1 Phosphoribosylformimino-5-aminoimidazole carboxamide ribotide isomerase [Prochlorococcus sp. MIT 0601]